ncbi:MAG: class I SAM-dependent methyltransferase [Candidatus Kerfeldbacteria bacterium]|nr:class I SAM-dependent methyltransferase [Candidatus Kerfeldbacteria bacterium]
MREEKFGTPNQNIEHESTAQRITEEWQKLFPKRYNPERPWYLNPEYLSSDQIIEALQVAFPDISFSVEPLPESELYTGYSVRYVNENGAWVTVNKSKKYSVESKCVGHIPVKHYSNDIQLYSLNDIRNFIAHPEAFYEFMDDAKIKQRMRSGLIHRAHHYLRSKWLISSGFYDTRTEGSKYLGYTMGMLLGYALERPENTEVLSTVLKTQRESYEKTNINELKERQVLQGMRILDIGCGRQGRFVKSLQEFGAEVFGLDIQFPNDPDDSIVHRGDISDMHTVPENIRNQQYDAVISTMTFVTEVDSVYGEALFNALSLVKPGGYAIFSSSLRYRVSELAELKDKFIDLAEQHPLLRPMEHDFDNEHNVTVIQAK